MSMNTFVKLPFCQLLIIHFSKKFCDVHVNSYNDIMCDINRGLGSGYCISAMLQCLIPGVCALLLVLCMVFEEIDFTMEADQV